MSFSEWERQKLDVQGFCDVEDPAVARGLRFSPLVCTVGAAAGTVLYSAAIMYFLAVMAAIGLVFHRTPFDWLYNRAISPVLETPPLPKRPAPSRFACFIAMVWCTLTGSAFLFGFTVIGTVLGVALVIVAGVMTVWNYCIASVIWRKLRGWPER